MLIFTHDEGKIKNLWFAHVRKTSLSWVFLWGKGMLYTKY